jgi:hypothetical protein
MHKVIPVGAIKPSAGVRSTDKPRVNRGHYPALLDLTRIKLENLIRLEDAAATGKS